MIEKIKFFLHLFYTSNKEDNTSYIGIFKEMMFIENIGEYISFFIKTDISKYKRKSHIIYLSKDKNKIFAY